MNHERLQRQLDFLYEADRIKSIIRKTMLFDGSRFENDAEHSWSVCLMALLFREYANTDIDITRVLLMLLIHDIVEIDAGDTYLYAAERADAPARERAAAERIFGMLEDDQRELFRGAWEEFEERRTPEARFAAVFDRMEPVLQNYRTQGAAWKEHGIRKNQVLAANAHIAEGSRELWEFIRALIAECVEKGYLAE